ncbi:MAG: hypothetical protein ACYTE5_11930, partial [Planctomycetota bacterium]
QGYCRTTLVVYDTKKTDSRARLLLVDFEFQNSPKDQYVILEIDQTQATEASSVSTVYDSGSNWSSVLDRI